MNRTDRTDAFILVAVADPLIHPEAMHVAAATTRAVVDVPTPVTTATLRRYVSRAAAVLVDAECADSLIGMDRHPACYFLTSERTPMDWEKALACHADKAFILPAESAGLLTALAHAPTVLAQTQSGRGATATSVVSVVGAVGGAGASTFAAALARVATRATPGPVSLIDASPTSPGLDLLLGVEDAAGARWPDVPLTTDEANFDREELRAALIHAADGVALLSAARSTVADSFRLCADSVKRAARALKGDDGAVVVDEPWTGNQTIGDETVVVLPAEVRAAASAAQIAVRLRADRREPLIVVRRRDWSGLETEEIEKIVGAPVIADVPRLPKLARDIELTGLSGPLPGPLRKAAVAVAERVWA